MIETATIAEQPAAAAAAAKTAAAAAARTGRPAFAGRLVPPC